MVGTCRPWTHNFKRLEVLQPRSRVLQDLFSTLQRTFFALGLVTALWKWNTGDMGLETPETERIVIPEPEPLRQPMPEPAPEPKEPVPV
jgi:hypothetical protein